MGLSWLKVCNFKSYEGVADLPLDKLPFVGVVGPNGSGKSNLLDAICFLVGSPLDKLRCKHVKELVTAGQELDSMYVEAEIEFDNSTTQFKRTSSAYSVNGEPVSFDAYKQKWADINVSENAKNCIVMQSDVQHLATATPLELARFIESINGFDDTNYKRDAEALSNAIEEVRKLVNRRNKAQAQHDSAQEINSTKEHAQSVRHRIRKLERRRVLLSSREKRALLAGLRKQVEDAKRDTEACMSSASSATNEAKSVRSVYARKRRALQTARVAERTAAAHVASIKAQLPPLQKQERLAASELRVQNPELEHAEKVKRSCEHERNACREKIAQFEREQSRQAQDSIDISDALKTQYAELNDAFFKSTALEQDSLELLERENAIVEQTKSQATRNVKEGLESEEQARARSAHLGVRKEQLERLLNERTKQRDANTKELEHVAHNAQKTKQETANLVEKRTELQHKLRSADGDKKSLAQRHKLLDSIERLRLEVRGVHGVLGALINPTDERFTLALEQGLGVYADAVVVDDFKAARECIALAKRERLGMFRFLPLLDLKTNDLTRVRAQLASESAKTKHEEARLLVDCARVAKELRPALVFALNETAFVPHLKTALDLRKRGLKMRMVSPDGESLSTNNLISITNSANLANAVSARGLASMERKYTQLNEKLSELAVLEQELQDKELRLTASIDTVSGAISAAKRELEICEEQAQSAARELRHCIDRRIKAETELESVSAKAEESHAQLTAKRAHLFELRTAAFKPFILAANAHNLSLKEWDELFAASAEKLLETAQTRQSLAERLAMATSRLNIANEQCSAQTQRYKSLAAQHKAVKQQTLALDLQLKQAAAKLEKANDKVELAHAAVEAKSDEMGAAEAATEAAQQRVADAEHEQTLKIMELASQLSALDDEDDGDVEQFADTEFLKDAVSIDKIDEQLTSLRTELRPLTALLELNTEPDEMDVDDEIGDLESQITAARTKFDKLAFEFSKQHDERRAKFLASLAPLQTDLSECYRELSEGQAQLTPVSDEDPFDGVHFSVKPAGKTFVPVERLSGGEQSMAALAFLFAFQKQHKAPFVVLDEADAALDFANVASLARYLTQNSKDTQFIVVSLKQRLYEHASHLVGVYKHSTSKVVTLKL